MSIELKYSIIDLEKASLYRLGKLKLQTNASNECMLSFSKLNRNSVWKAYFGTWIHANTTFPYDCVWFVNLAVCRWFFLTWLVSIFGFCFSLSRAVGFVVSIVSFSCCHFGVFYSLLLGIGFFSCLRSYDDLYLLRFNNVFRVSIAIFHFWWSLMVSCVVANIPHVLSFFLPSNMFTSLCFCIFTLAS